VRGFDREGGLADAARSVNERSPGAGVGGEGGGDDFEFGGATEEVGLGGQGGAARGNW
jgi:hypothetical protein